jgi:endonuclease/exonuclease/phosphatase family metal-dependent hydrolase
MFMTEPTNKIVAKANGATVEALEAPILKRPAELRYRKDFRIGTYNVHNLFGDKPDVYSSQPDPPAPVEQLKALGNMIRQLDADAIAFQEVQNEAVLKHLFQDYVNPALRRNGEDTFDTFVFVPARDPRGINVALATRLAVRGTVTFHDYEFGPVDEHAVRFARDLLGVEVFATPKYSFLFFVAHLKSKLARSQAQSEHAEEKRQLEANEIRELLGESVFGGKPYIAQDLVLAGDMNDDPDSDVIAILRGKNPTALRDLMADVEPNYTYPTHHRRAKTRLDFIFASPTMVDHVDLGSLKIHRDDPAAVASDHYPSSLSLKVAS